MLDFFPGPVRGKGWLVLLVLLLSDRMAAQSPRPQPIDARATGRTQALYANLHRTTAAGHILFGHQDALAYGVGWRAQAGGSDVQAVCGDYPAVYGWELGDLEHDSTDNIDRVNFTRMKQWIKDGYRRGGIITISWHMDNYASGGSAWDTTVAVRDILPGGRHHARYVADLDRFARFVNDLRVGGRRDRHLVPILFRPFHEHTGHWFWWCGPFTTPGEYRSLWRFTVEYLRDKKQLHNLLYVFNTSENFDSPEEFLRYYPGDEWVDVLSFDDYGDLRDSFGFARLRERLCIVAELADRKGKLAALAETGLESIPQADWWTGALLHNLRAEPVGRRMAWVLVWRNDNPKHHYAPYPGHVSAADFLSFYRENDTFFERDLPRMYKKPRPATRPGRPSQSRTALNNGL